VFIIRLSRRAARAQVFGNDDGSFKINPQDALPVTLSVNGPEFEPASVADVEVTPGRTTELGTITVKRGRVLRGRVLRADGTPQPGAWVVAGHLLLGSGSRPDYGENGPSVTGASQREVTDARGEFVMRGISAGEITVIAGHAAGGRSAPVAVPPDPEEPAFLSIVLAAPSALEGTVLREGKPAEGVTVQAQSQSSPTVVQEVKTGPDGAFRFDSLANDQYSVAATQGSKLTGVRHHARSVRVESGKTSRVELVIVEGASEVKVVPKAKQANGRLGFTMIFGADGALEVSTARAINEAVARRDRGWWSWNISTAGSPATVTGLTAGAYTFCAVPYPESVKELRTLVGYMQTEGAKLAAFCKAVTVGGTAGPQELVIDVQMPAPPATN
jgi:hypothetical protein